MSIQVLSTGLFSSIQDQGRYGYARYGVPVSGAMDQYSARFANLLLGNDPDCAVMEVTLQGPRLKFLTETLLGVSGLGAEILLNGKKVPINRPHRILKNQELRILRVTRGMRVYLAVKGGFKTEVVLGSRSFYDPLTVQQLSKKSRLPILEEKRVRKLHHARLRFDKARFLSQQLEVYPGPEWQELSKGAQTRLLKTLFSVAETSNRMAYQLKEKLPHELSGMITQPVLPGTVQYTPAGDLIILMRDGQVTGGYPRVLQLTGRSIDRLAQKNVGEQIRFELKNKG